MWDGAGGTQPSMAQLGGAGGAGTTTRTPPSNAGTLLAAVERVQGRDRHGRQRGLWQQHLFAHPEWCDGSGVGSALKMAAPGAALPGLG